MNRRSFIGMSALGAIGPTTSKVPQIFPAQRMGSEDALRHYQAVQALGWYSVRDPAFGAKGNNADDDTQAFQAAIDTAPDGSTVYVPPCDPGKAYIISSLTIKKPLTLLGSPGLGSLLKGKKGAAGYMLNISGFPVGATLGPEGHLQGVYVQGLRLEGNLRQPSYGAMSLAALEHSTVQDLIIESFTMEALDLFSSVRECVFWNIHMRFCGDIDTNTPAINLYDRSAQDRGPGTDAHNLLHFDQVFSVFPYGDHFLLDTIAGKPRFWVRDIKISNSILHGILPGVNSIGNPVPTVGQQACRHFVVKGATPVTLDHVTSLVAGTGVPFIAVLPSAGGLRPQHLLIDSFYAAGRYAYSGDQTGIDLTVGDLTLEHSYITGNQTAAVRAAAGTTVRLGDGNNFGFQPVIINGSSASRFYGIVTLDSPKFNQGTVGGGAATLGANCPAGTPAAPY